MATDSGKTLTLLIHRGKFGQSTTHKRQITPIKTYKKGNTKGYYIALGPTKASKKLLWHQ